MTMASEAPAAAKFERRELVVVVKCLNEERHIRNCLTSAVEAVSGMDAIVVVADSGSTDRTIEIASEFPVRIVRLTEGRLKSCGLGAQLGYQFCDCDFVYILDGDMTIDGAGLKVLLQQLKADGTLAGVGGLVEEMGEGNYEFERRKIERDGAISGEVRALDMGGLYRVSALEGSYLTNPNLHSHEEKELAYRLTRAGGRLYRTDQNVIRHFGKTQDTTALLLARWKSAHIDGSGEYFRFLVRSGDVAEGLRRFWNLALLGAAWALGLTGLILVLLGKPLGWIGPAATAGLYLLLFIRFLVRSRSIRKAVVATVNLSVLTAAFVRGAARPQRNPRDWLPAEVLK
jgi:glycosyltransferase involved in cell wall biosynthesis